MDVSPPPPRRNLALTAVVLAVGAAVGVALWWLVLRWLFGVMAL